MVSWVLIAVVILFPLIQVPLVIYIGRYTKLREGERPVQSPGREFWDDRGDAPDHEDRRDQVNRGNDRQRKGTKAQSSGPVTSVTCPECGAENGPGFRYCGACASSLSAAAD